MKTIKRYANRKLYDTSQSCYVTLEDIGQMVRAGEELQVVDNKSGEDLTQVTLAQIIFEIEKRRSFMPLGLLRTIIQAGGDTLGRVQTTAQQVRARAQRLRSALARPPAPVGEDFARVLAEARHCLAELEAAGTPGPYVGACELGAGAASRAAAGDGEPAARAAWMARLQGHLDRLEGLAGRPADA